MEKILDSYALLAYLEEESGYSTVESLFVNAIEKNTKLLITTVNWGEVFYKVLRMDGKERALDVEKMIDTFPIKIVDIDRRIAREAANFKAWKRMSYADCFAAALTKINSGELITGDKEFKEVEKEIKIIWI